MCAKFSQIVYLVQCYVDGWLDGGRKAQAPTIIMARICRRRRMKMGLYALYDDDDDARRARAKEYRVLQQVQRAALLCYPTIRPFVHDISPRSLALLLYRVWHGMAVVVVGLICYRAYVSTYSVL